MKSHFGLNDKTQIGNIELYGNKEAIIEGCECVADYSAEFIKIDIGKMYLKISGRDLVIESYIYKQIDVKGEIISLEFMN